MRISRTTSLPYRTIKTRQTPPSPQNPAASLVVSPEAPARFGAKKQNARVKSSLEQYLEEINKRKLLSADEERELGQIIQSRIKELEEQYTIEKELFWCLEQKGVRPISLQRMKKALKTVGEPDSAKAIIHQEISLADLPEDEQAQLNDLLEARAKLFPMTRPAQAAVDRLVEHNTRLVVNIAKKYQGKGVSFHDLIGEGNQGLVRAAKKYDPSVGTRFSTYATWWIKQPIRLAIMNQRKPIRIPVHMVQTLGKWKVASETLADKLGRPPTPAEIGKAMGLGKDQVSMVLHVIRTNAAQPEYGNHDDYDGWNALNSVIAQQADVENTLDQKARTEEIMEILDKLDNRKVAIFKMRRGLNDSKQEMTLEETGRIFSLTKERIRQIENEIEGQLKKILALRKELKASQKPFFLSNGASAQ